MHHHHRSSSYSNQHEHQHQHHHHHQSSSSRSDAYSVVSGLSGQYRDMRSYVVDVHPDDYPRSRGSVDDYPRSRTMADDYPRSRTMVPEPVLTSVSLGVRVRVDPNPNAYPDTADDLDRELTPLFHRGEDVIFANDIFEVVGKAKLTREGHFRYPIRHKHDRDAPIEVLEDQLIRLPPRLYETGAIVRHQRDGRKYEILGAAFLPQEGVWDYRITRYSATERGDIKRNAFEPKLMRVNSEESHLTPPTSRHSPTRPGPSPKGSFSSLVDSLLFKH